MRKSAGFTLIEMVIATTIFAAGSLFIYSTFAGVTSSGPKTTLQIDLGSQNKRALTKFYNEIQATSLTPQDTDGLDNTEPVPVFVIENDTQAPKPLTKNLIVQRGVGSADQKGGVWQLGESKEQARERLIARSKRLRFRKVVGYAFNATAGTIVPEWSEWITYEVDGAHHLVRRVPGKRTRVIASRVDALDAVANPDGTLVVTLITARRNPDGHGWKRYANAVTIHPKN